MKIEDCLPTLQNGVQHITDNKNMGTKSHGRDRICDIIQNSKINQFGSIPKSPQIGWVAQR